MIDNTHFEFFEHFEGYQEPRFKSVGISNEDLGKCNYRCADHGQSSIIFSLIYNEVD